MRVLFVGNSQMMTYELPQMIKVMSESAPAGFPRIEPGEALAGGMTLKSHWEKGEQPGTPRAMIAADKWDYVVLQEIFMADQHLFATYATMFDEAIKKAGAKTILFATASVTKDYHVSCHFPDASKALNDMQIEFGKQRKLRVAAAGYAWMKYLGPNPSDAQILDLYHRDRGHPGSKGTYIYACLLYAMITGKNPAGLTSEFKDIQGGIIIRQDEAAKMQQAAWEQYLETSKK